MAAGARTAAAIRRGAAPAPLRVLVMAHSHPRLTRGGAEISAYALFRNLRRQPGVRAWFIGCSNAESTDRAEAGFTQPFGADDFIYQLGHGFNDFKFANRDPRYPDALRRLVAELQPDIVHCHHYLNFGVETFLLIRQAWPAARIVLSLHEFLAICHNDGLLVTTDGRLCGRESPQDCAACFPHVPAREFFLRRRYIQSFLEDVDAFVAPSRFLAGRYVAWGIPEPRMTVLENMPPPSPPRPVQPAPEPAPGPRIVRFGFFGQMSPVKGIGLLVAAAKLLALRGDTAARIDIHGDFTHQPAEARRAVAAALAEAPANVIHHGPYHNADVHALMQGFDAILVPSTWWENSPVVIQEAFANGRPVICSNVGGMAEKVRPGIDGFHFDVGQPGSLADLLAALAADPGRLDRIRLTMAATWTEQEGTLAHLALYQATLQAPALPGARAIA